MPEAPSVGRIQRFSPRARHGIIAATVAVTLLVAFAAGLVQTQSKSRRDLEERFHLRGTIAARFIETYISEIAVRERQQAERHLSGARVSDSQFQIVMEWFPFEAAVLLDAEGRLLRVEPPDASIIGQKIVDRYDHLRAAVDGRIAVSSIVPSAAEGVPVIGFAVPYDTPFGRRVFSGAFEVARTPLHAYPANALPLRGGEVYLLDANGRAIAGGHESVLGKPLHEIDAALARTLAQKPRGTYTRDTQRYFSAHRIGGTPWRIVLSVPVDSLYEPISGQSIWVPWILFAAFAVAALGGVYLLTRLADARARLQDVNDELRTRNDQVAAYAARQRDFVATASHELRTPLTSIKGYLDLALRDPLSDDQRHNLEVVRRNADRLQALVADLLVMNQVESGNLMTTTTSAAISDVVRPTLDAFTPVCAGKGIDLRVNIPDGLPDVKVDPGRTEQILGNILSNAIKFTPPGGSITIGAVARDGAVALNVADTGMGIDPDELPHVFDRFFRSSSAMKMAVPGTGLGLPIAKALAEAQGGSLSVTSAPNEGTTFTLTLPSERSRDGARARG